MKAAKIIFICCSVFLFSCGNEPKKVDEKTPEKVKIRYPEAIQNQLSYFPLLRQEYVIDSLLLERLQAEDTSGWHRLAIEEVKLLTVKMNRDDFTEPTKYYLNDFYKIEKHKLNGTYEAYKDSLDLGVVEDVNCFAYGRIEFGDSLSILLWRMNYKSFDACPAYSGTNIMASLIVKGKVKRTMQFAAYESAMDAPMVSNTYQLANIKKEGLMERKQYVSVEEEDEIIEKGQQVIFNHITTQGFIKM